MTRAAWILAAWLAPLPAFAASSTSTASALSPKEREILSEMRDRRMINPELTRWTPAHEEQLLAIRNAERRGAVGFLREKQAALGGFVVARKGKDGMKELRLTLEGYNRYVFLRSQEARGYFEKHGVEARDVFRLRTVEGKKLFNGDGELKPAGVELYEAALKEEPVSWLLPDGRTLSNARPVRPEETPAPAPKAP